MGLQIWLPLNGDFHNQGILGNLNFTKIGSGTIIDTNEGKIGKAKEFSAAGLKAPLSYTLGSQFSFSCWIYYNSFQTNNEWILELGDTESGYANALFGIASTPTKLVVCVGGAYDSATVHDFVINTWYHLAFTYDGTTWKIYKNGQLIRNFDKNISSITSSSNITIASNVASSVTKLNGRLNDIRIYNNCLSDNEIKKLSKGLILHYPLSRRGLGENLLKASDVSVTNSSYPTKSYYFGDDPPQQGEQVTIQIKGHLADTKTYWRIYNSGGTVDCIIIQKTAYNEHTGIYTATGTWKISKEGKPDAANTYLNVYPFTKTQSGQSTIEWIKLERGNHATPWCPNAADEKYTLLGLNNNVQYDISGFQNNGTKNNITYSSDAPKYNVSSVFNSADTSYIKVNENNWIPQYQEAMTINFWVYSSDWTSTIKLFSCAQSGGWTTEPGNSGYIRFSIYVATNQARTSHGYKFNSQELKISDLSAGWHMLTFIYDSTGNKVYVDGQSHSSYAFTSYGIKYNTNARLFLGCEANSASPSTPYFDGKVSDFRIYATVLSEKDILSLYNNEAYIDQLNAIHGEIR